MRIHLAAPAIILASIVSTVAFAQGSITCETVQAAASLPAEQQIALGRAAAAQVAAETDPAASDALQGCIAVGPPQLRLAFQQNAAPPTADILLPLETTTGDNDDDVGNPRFVSPS